MRRARWKRKNVRDELTGKAVNSPKTGTGRHELPTELETPLPAALYLNLKSVRSRICGHGAQRDANRTSPAPLFAAAPPSPRGVSKGEGRSPPLCVVSRGCGGKSKSPLPGWLFRPFLATQKGARRRHDKKTGVKKGNMEGASARNKAGRCGHRPLRGGALRWPWRSPAGGHKGRPYRAAEV